ncbi:MAG: hypothetical protein DWI57_13055 [Chloroflexi bacterium]|nr:MAG: hypothetical protein DWI57_13055 [Chloroflexota bacterium]
MTEFSSIPAHARWIGSDHPFDLHEVYLDFRSPADFSLDPQLASAQLFISADSRYKVWVNGVFVGRGPARSWPHAQQFDSHDIAPLLHTGKNSIAVQVYQPGYSHFAYLHRGAAGLLAWLECDSTIALVSDQSWRVRRDPSFSAAVERVSIYSSGVEERDLRLADDWSAPDYNAAAWAAARIVAPAESPLWSGLRQRTTPLLGEERTIFTSQPLCRLGSMVTESDDPHAQIRTGWPAAPPLTLAMDKAGWFTPTIKVGETAYWLFDLGHGHTCQGIAEVEGAGGAESLLVSYGDKRRDGELVISDPTTYCRVHLTDRTHLQAGDQIVEGFSLRGGRFLLFALTGPAWPGLRIRFGVRTAAYPLLDDRPLTTDDPELDAIIRLCETTLRACLQDTFVDGVWRESSQWLGDALVQAQALWAMSSDARPMRATLEMAAQGAYADGVLPSILPGEVHSYCVVDYNFSWVELLAFYFSATDDQDFVVRQWPTLTKLLERFHQDSASDGLIRSQPGRRLFLDWSPQSRQEPNAVYNLRYLYALQQAAGLAEALGGAEAQWVEVWGKRAKALRLCVAAAFRSDERWWDDSQRSTRSQLAAALALLTGAAEMDEWNGLAAALVARSLNLDDSQRDGQLVLASPFMHHYIFEALHRAGQNDAVVEIIRCRWGRWAAGGFPTTWENWNVDFPDGSQCHAFSAHPRYHLARILGERVSG